MSRKLVLLVIYRSLSNKFFKIIKLSLNIISEVLSPKPILFVTLPRRLENTEKNFRALGPRCHLAPCAHRPKAARLLLAVLSPGHAFLSLSPAPLHHPSQSLQRQRKAAPPSHPPLDIAVALNMGRDEAGRWGCNSATGDEGFLQSHLDPRYHLITTLSSVHKKSTEP